MSHDTQLLRFHASQRIFFHDSAATAVFCDTNDGVQMWFMTSAFGPGRAASRAQTQYGEISGVNLPFPFDKTILTTNSSRSHTDLDLDRSRFFASTPLTMGH